MAQGDWGPGAKIRPTLVNFQFDHTGEPSYFGIGYQVIGASGNVLNAHGGYRWQPGDHREPIRAALRQLLIDAVAAEGVSGVDFGLAPTVDGLRKP